MVDIFLGPTLPRENAQAILHGTYHPPVQLGDIYRLARRKVARILIVDGCFDNVPAVWHKEILFAMAEGVEVFGCSSMGALRAAELHRYGMVGIGQIFDRYLAGEYEDDDEVAVAHGMESSGYRKLSEAMVDIRYGLTLAEQRQLISAETHHWIAATAKGTFYPDRHWGTLLRLAAERGLPSGELVGLRRFVRDEKPSLKQRDAAEALSSLARNRVSPGHPSFCFEPTSSWRRLVTLESAASRERGFE